MGFGGMRAAPVPKFILVPVPNFWYRYQIKTSYFCQKRINLHFRVSLPSHRGANASSKHFSVDQSKVFYQKIGTGTKKLVLVPKIGTGTKIGTGAALHPL
jgi:hypothetical protein